MAVIGRAAAPLPRRACSPTRAGPQLAPAVATDPRQLRPAATGPARSCCGLPRADYRALQSISSLGLQHEDAAAGCTAVSLVCCTCSSPHAAG